MLVLAGVAGVVLLGGVAGQRWWVQRGDGSLERVRAAGRLRIGYAVEAPYAMLDARGQVTGESPETARRIAARLALPPIEWVQVPFAELIPSLLERRFDLVAAGLFVTGPRARQVRFSDPTVRVLPGLLVRRGNPKHLGGYRALAGRADARVAVLEGSVEQQRLRGFGVAPEALLAVPDLQAGRAAVATGAADALALSLPTVRGVAGAAPERFEALADEVAPGASRELDFVAFAFHRDDAQLQQAWNAAQVGWIGSAEHARTVAPFGFGPAELAAGVRLEDVLAP